MSLLIAALWVMAVYLGISVILWPFLIGNRRVITTAYAVGNMIASGILAVLLIWAALVIAAGGS